MRNIINHKNDIKSFIKAWYNSDLPIRSDIPQQLKKGFIDEFNNHHTIRITHLKGESGDFCLSDEIRFFFGLPTKEIVIVRNYDNFNDFVGAWYNSSYKKMKNIPEELKIGFIDGMNFHHTTTKSNMHEHSFNAMSKDMFNFFLESDIKST